MCPGELHSGDSRENSSGLPTIAGTRRVLLVDDNRDALELLAELLRGLGHEVEAAGDGMQAIELLERFRPDVAVLDIGLPMMDGYELARHLQHQLGDETPKLIALTGYGQEQDRRRSKKAGFAVHLVKPVNLPALLAEIDDA